MNTIFPTTYVRPRSLEELRSLTLTPNTLAVAGGALLFGEFEPPYEQFIDLQSVEELGAVEASDDMLRLGGAAMLSEVLASPLVDVTYKRALRRTLNPNLCNGASVGESLLAHRPVEWLAQLAACDARLAVFDAREQQIFFVRDLEQTDLRGRVIAAVDLPRAGVLGSAFVARTPADLPIVCAAVDIRLNEDNTIFSADAALGGVSARLLHIEMLECLRGQPWVDVDFAEAAACVHENVSPVGDVFGSADYRREMAAVLTRRALEDARERWIANTAAS